MAEPLVSFEQAKKHLRVTDNDHDDEIEDKRQQASDIIHDYLDTQDDATWTEETAPFVVQAAALLMLGHLYENRGGDLKEDETVWAAIDRLLKRYRDPALA